MYKTFYRLRVNPFGNSPDPRFLYMMPHTREALAALEFGISARRGFIVLTGEAGTGKTTLLRRTIESFDPKRVLSSYIFNPRLDVLDFLEFVLKHLQISCCRLFFQVSRSLPRSYRPRSSASYASESRSGVASIPSRKSRRLLISNVVC